jgi:excisionase family DNA binding protein
MDLPATLTVNQVAELLQVEPRTIRRNIEFGESPRPQDRASLAHPQKFRASLP